MGKEYMKSKFWKAFIGQVLQSLMILIEDFKF